MRIIVGISGASGSIYGLRLLEKLRSRPEVETHLIVTRAGRHTLRLETGLEGPEIDELAHFHHDIEDLAAPPASGSFQADAMVVAPCSVHSMSAIAHGISSNLLVRAADVTLKERRKLILMVRETPLHLGHLRTMTALAEMGAIVCPPMPAFYNRPESVLEVVDGSLERVLDLLGLPEPGARRWGGGPDRVQS